VLQVSDITHRNPDEHINAWNSRKWNTVLDIAADRLSEGMRPRRGLSNAECRM
jgi:hypothetical protein